MGNNRVDVEVKGQEHEFTICGDGHAALVTVNPCTGEVIIHNRDRLTEAAQIFWDAMMFEGKSMHHRILELEKKIERIKKVRIIVSRPPGPSADFVDAENERGESISVGTWTEEDGLFVLTLNEIDLAVKKVSNDINDNEALTAQIQSMQRPI